MLLSCQSRRRVTVRRCLVDLVHLFTAVISPEICRLSRITCASVYIYRHHRCMHVHLYARGYVCVFICTCMYYNAIDVWIHVVQYCIYRHLYIYIYLYLYLHILSPRLLLSRLTLSGSWLKGLTCQFPRLHFWPQASSCETDLLSFLPLLVSSIRIKLK